MSSAASSGTELITAGRPWLHVNGRRAERLEADLIALEARADPGGVAQLEATFVNWGSRSLGAPVDYVHFDPGEVDFGAELRVAFTVTGKEETVFDGLVSGIGADYPELRPPELTLLAEDRLMGLRLRQRTRLYEDMNDAAIAEQIATDAGLQANLGSPGAVHRQLLQVNQVELEALRARTRDDLIRLENGQLRITPAVGETDPPIRLSRENELIRFNVLADLAHQRASVRVHGWDVAAKEGIHEAVGSEAILPEAEAGRLGPDVVGRVFQGAAQDLHLEAPSTREEARSLAEAAMRRRARRFVRGMGVARGIPALRVGSRVDLVDLGPWFGGIYLVTAIQHRFDQINGYRTGFEVQRPHLGGAP